MKDSSVKGGVKNEEILCFCGHSVMLVGMSG